MNNKLKDEINILKVSDIGGFIKNQELNYLIMELNDYVKIEIFPIVFNNYLTTLYNNIAYDYDILNEDTKEQFKLFYKRVKKINDDKYEYATKCYVKKRRNNIENVDKK